METSHFGDLTEGTHSNAEIVYERLTERTSKPSEDFIPLFRKHGLDAANLPDPSDERIKAFVRDVLFASCDESDLLAALYGP
jgi:hypothetical protein